MAIITLHKMRESSEPLEHFECFYCARSITTGGPVIVWQGATGLIELHPECVIELAIRLFRDVHQVECGTGRYVTARTLPELQARLTAEEWRP